MKKVKKTDSGISFEINSHSRDECLLCNEAIKIKEVYLYLHKYRGTQGAQSARVHESCLRAHPVNKNHNLQKCQICEEKAYEADHIKVPLHKTHKQTMTVHNNCLSKTLDISNEAKANLCYRAKNPTTRSMSLIVFKDYTPPDFKKRNAILKKVEATERVENMTDGQLNTIINSRFKLVKNRYEYDSRLCFKAQIEAGFSIDVSINGTSEDYYARVDNPYKRIVNLTRYKFNQPSFLLHLVSEGKYNLPLNEAASLLLTDSSELIRGVASKYFTNKDVI